MKVLVTGASGQAGPGVVNALAKRHKLRLTDLIKSDKLSIYPWVVGSITDHQTLAKAVNGMDAVVHMARVFRHPGTDPTTDDFLDVNVKGTYLLLEAAAKAGVKVFVHISSTAHVIGNWYEGKNITIDSPATTSGRYSLTKLLQEVICEHFSRNSEMRIVALRPWGLCEADQRRRQVAAGQKEYHPGLIDTEDLGRAALAAIENDRLGKYEIFYCMATGEACKRFDMDRTAELLGWHANDSFADIKPSDREGDV